MVKREELDNAVDELIAVQLSIAHDQGSFTSALAARDLGYYWCRYSEALDWEIQERATEGWLVVGSGLVSDEDPQIVGPRVGAPDWRPIKTAPMDGTKVDLWDAGGFRLTDRSWSVHQWRNGEPDAPPSWGPSRDGNPPPNPTHWMPVPAGPINR